VSDHGPGIPQALSKEIFDFRSLPAGRRHGHEGLSIARTIIKHTMADMGQKSRIRRRIVSDQASSCLIIGAMDDPCETDPTSAHGTFRTSSHVRSTDAIRGKADVAWKPHFGRE
jgi:hypothetical protein